MKSPLASVVGLPETVTWIFAGVGLVIFVTLVIVNAEPLFQVTPGLERALPLLVRQPVPD